MASDAPSKLVSVNIGLPREVTWKNRSVATGIFKQPVAGSVAVRGINLDGDRQADLSVHGGPDKAVYAYPAEHYPYWREQLPDYPFGDPPWAQFGENLTTLGLLEGDVYIGDRYRVGTVELQVTQPRLPCYKLGIRFGRTDMLKRFLKSERTGWYFRIVTEGTLAAGDAISLVARDPHHVSVTDLVRLYSAAWDDPAALRAALAHALTADALPTSWRDDLRERLERLDA